jgi:hypothetical protein
LEEGQNNEANGSDKEEELYDEGQHKSCHLMVVVHRNDPYSATVLLIQKYKPHHTLDQSKSLLN